MRKTLLITILLYCGLAYAQTHTIPTLDNGNIFTGQNNDFTLGLQMGPTTAAGLATNSPNGTAQIFCSDCKVQNSCVTGGTGVWASFINGVWNCSGSAFGVTTISGSAGVFTNGATSVGSLPLFVTNATTIGNSLWTDNGSSSLYSGSSVGVGVGDASCGTASGCIAMTEGTTEGTPTAGHDYIRPDAAFVYSSHTLVSSVNGDGPFLMMRSRNTGAVGQVAISNADGTFTAGDPNISVSSVPLFSAQSATGTATSPATTNPLRGGAGQLTISGTGITGSPAGCSIQLFYSQTGSGATDIAPFATAFFTPANPKQNFGVSPNTSLGAFGDNIVGIYSCVTYPSAGTITVTFNGGLPIAPAGTTLPMNLQAVGGQALSANIPISHDPSQTSTCSANSNAATNTLTISGLVINAGDTVMVGTGTGANVTVSSVTDSGGSVYTAQLVTRINGASRATISGTAAGAALASTTLTVNMSGNAKFVACVTTYNGVQSFGSSGNNVGTSTNPFVNVNTQDPGNFVFAVLSEATTNVMTANTGTLLSTTQTTATTPASAAICDNTAAVPTVNLQCGTTATSASWASVGLELRSSANTGASVPVQLVAPQQQLSTPLNVSTQVNSSGLSAQSTFCDKQLSVNGTSPAAGSVQQLAINGTTAYYVCGVYVVNAAASAETVKLVYGTGTNCATAPADLTVAAALPATLGAQAFLQFPFPVFTPAGQAVCINSSPGATAYNFQIVYANH